MHLPWPLELLQVYARQLGRVYKRELREFFETLRQHHLVRPSADEIEPYSAACCGPGPRPLGGGEAWVHTPSA